MKPLTKRKIAKVRAYGKAERWIAAVQFIMRERSLSVKEASAFVWPMIDKARLQKRRGG
jgi:hypothetical protein